MNNEAKQPLAAVKKIEKPRIIEAQKVQIPKKTLAPWSLQLKFRHWVVGTSFLVCVIIPVMVFALYLYLVAADQYSSRVGFFVRTEEPGVSSEFLGSVLGVSSDSSKDTDILFEFIQSQQLIEEIDQKLDLRSLYRKPSFDPLFSFGSEESIEELRDYWGRVVKIYYDSGTGLMELRVNAFSAQDARLVATEIFNSSSKMINELSAIARKDSRRYAKDELDKALRQLKNARKNITFFRTRTQIVDPTADVQGQMGLLTNLQSQLAETLIELDLLKQVTKSGDPRIKQATGKVTIIQRRIDEERNKFGLATGQGDETFSLLVGQYEALVVDREFAEQTYLTSRALYEQALAESDRQSRYLAAYVEPTLAQTPEYPKRSLLLLSALLVLVVSWAILVLTAYSIKDRR